MLLSDTPLFSVRVSTKARDQFKSGICRNTLPQLKFIRGIAVLEGQEFLFSPGQAYILIFLLDEQEFTNVSDYKVFTIAIAAVLKPNLTTRITSAGPTVIPIVFKV